jgi:hypothetical protein
LAAEHEKVLDGTLYVVPFKDYQAMQRLKMAVANISAGADEYEYGPDGKKSPFLADTFWEDYKNYDIPQFGTVRVHLDETEQADIDYQER